MIKTRLIQAAVVAMLCAVPLGCMPHPRFTLEKDAAVVSRTRTLVEESRPSEVNAIHRVILTVGRRQYVMTGYAKVEGSHLRLVAINELGATLFEAEKDGQEVRADKLAPPFRKRHIEQGALHDLEVIYSMLPEKEALLKKGPRGGLFSLKAWPHPRRVYKFDSETGAITDYWEFRFFKKVYEAHLSDFKPAEGQSGMLPGKIQIANRRLHYSLEIEVLDHDPRESGDDAGR